MPDGSEIRVSGGVRPEARISRAEDPDFERLPGIRTTSILLDIIEDIMMMFLILDILFFSFIMF